MYIVTGAAGFIGSEIVKALNDRGVTDILAVDDLSNGQKIFNLNDCRFSDYMDMDDLLDAMEGNAFGKVTAILHQGACSDTMEYDGRYMMDVNFSYSKQVLNYAAANRIPLVYASSASTYGNNTTFVEDPENEKPINVYAFSKYAFDMHVRSRMKYLESTVVGLRYFNVYGVRETFKGRMASMVYQLYKQLRNTGVARLFEGTDGYPDGGQERDFVFVGDVAKVNLFFAQGPARQGIFNTGTGAARSFNDIASTLIKLMGKGRVEYIPFNATLKGKYQSFTQADVSALRAAGYSAPFATLEQGIEECYEQWEARAGALPED
jgi:ADP-L-glycero-D-manno-heptose 6-epimerase